MRVEEVYSGSLLPNTTYEAAAHAFGLAHGSPNVYFNSATAVVTGFAQTLATGSKTTTRDYQSQICASPVGCTVSNDVSGVFDYTLEVTKAEPILSFDLDTTGSGFDGGGFSFDPVIKLVFDSLGGAVTFSGGDGFVVAAAPSPTPIPSSALLLATGFVGMAGLGRFRKARG